MAQDEIPTAQPVYKSDAEPVPDAQPKLVRKQSSKGSMRRSGSMKKGSSKRNLVVPEAVKMDEVPMAKPAKYHHHRHGSRQAVQQMPMQVANIACVNCGRVCQVPIQQGGVFIFSCPYCSAYQRGRYDYADGVLDATLVGLATATCCICLGLPPVN